MGKGGGGGGHCRDPTGLFILSLFYIKFFSLHCCFRQQIRSHFGFRARESTVEYGAHAADKSASVKLRLLVGNKKTNYSIETRSSTITSTCCLLTYTTTTIPCTGCHTTRGSRLPVRASRTSR